MTTTATDPATMTDDERWQRYSEENVEAETLALEMMNAHARNGGSFGVVTWKDEGDAGPVYVYVTRENVVAKRVVLDDERAHCPTCGWPEGMHSRAKQREGEFYLGWMSRSEARRLAKWARVKLEDV